MYLVTFFGPLNEDEWRIRAKDESEAVDAAVRHVAEMGWPGWQDRENYEAEYEGSRA